MRTRTLTLAFALVAIATLGDLLRYLETQSDPALTAFHPAVLAYRQRYGV